MSSMIRSAANAQGQSSEQTTEVVEAAVSNGAFSNKDALNGAAAQSAAVTAEPEGIGSAAEDASAAVQQGTAARAGGTAASPREQSSNANARPASTAPARSLHSNEPPDSTAMSMQQAIMQHSIVKQEHVARASGPDPTGVAFHPDPTPAQPAGPVSVRADKRAAELHQPTSTGGQRLSAAAALGPGINVAGTVTAASPNAEQQEAPASLSRGRRSSESPAAGAGLASSAEGSQTKKPRKWLSLERVRAHYTQCWTPPLLGAYCPCLSPFIMSFHGTGRRRWSQARCSARGRTPGPAQQSCKLLSEVSRPGTWNRCDTISNALTPRQRSVLSSELRARPGFLMTQAREPLQQRVQSGPGSTDINGLPAGDSAAPEQLPSATRLGCSRCRYSPGGCLSCHPEWAIVQATKRQATREVKLAKEIARLQELLQQQGAMEGSVRESGRQMLAWQSAQQADDESPFSMATARVNLAQAAAGAEHGHQADESADAAPVREAGANQPTPPPWPRRLEVDGMGAAVEAKAAAPGSPLAAGPRPEAWQPPLPLDEYPSNAALQALPPPDDEHVPGGAQRTPSPPTYERLSDADMQPSPAEATPELPASVALSAEEVAAVQEVSDLLGCASLGLSREGTAAMQHVVAQCDGAPAGTSVVLSPVDHANVKHLLACISSGQPFPAQQPAEQRAMSSQADHMPSSFAAAGHLQEPSSLQPPGVFSATTPYSLPTPDGGPARTQSTPLEGHQHRPLRGLHPNHRPWERTATAAQLPNGGLVGLPAGEVDVPGLHFDPAVDVPRPQQGPSNTTRIGGRPTLRLPSATGPVRGSGRTARRGGGRGAPHRAVSAVPTVSASAPAAHSAGMQQAPTLPLVHAQTLAMAPGAADHLDAGPLALIASTGATALTAAASLDAPLPGLGPDPHEGLEAATKLLLPLRKLKLLATIDMELYTASKSAAQPAASACSLWTSNRVDTAISMRAAHGKTHRRDDAGVPIEAHPAASIC